MRDTRTVCRVKDLILILTLKELERHILALCVLIPMLCSGGEAFSFLATHHSKRAQGLWIFCSSLSSTGWPEFAPSSSEFLWPLLSVNMASIICYVILTINNTHVICNIYYIWSLVIYIWSYKCQLYWLVILRMCVWKHIWNFPLSRAQ